MKINVKEWLAMDVSKRFYSIAQAVRQNDVSLKRHKKKPTSTSMRVSG